jgi:phage terminase large subunit GpA-like protein
MERWTVDFRVIQGSPAEQATWDALDQLLLTPYRHASGRTMTIRGCAIDTGGTATQEVYDFTRRRRHRGVLGIKGASRPGRPVIASRPSKVDVNWRGRIERSGAELWMVGTDTAKDWLSSRWLLGKGAGAIHFSADLPTGFYAQLVAEKRMTRYVKGRKRVDWVKAKGDPNEALDLCVYNLAMAYYLGLNRYRDADWARLRAQIDPDTGDLFDDPPPGFPGNAEPDEGAEADQADAPKALPPPPAPVVAPPPEKPANTFAPISLTDDPWL